MSKNNLVPLNTIFSMSEPDAARDAHKEFILSTVFTHRWLHKHLVTNEPITCTTYHPSTIFLVFYKYFLLYCTAVNNVNDT